MTRFLQAIAHYSPADEAFDATSERDEEDSDSTLDEADRSFLHQYLSDHSEQLGVELLRGKHAGLRYWQEGVLAVPSATGQATWAQLTDLIAALGSPPEAAARAAAAQWEASPEQAFSRFMARNDVRASVDGREWESVFYEVAGNKVWRPNALCRRFADPPPARRTATSPSASFLSALKPTLPNSSRSSTSS